MSDDARHEDLEAMVAPWVLDSLDPAEAETVRAHVEGCATCREVAARLRRIVSALPLAVDEVSAPARLRDRVLAAAAASPRAAAPAARRVRRPSPLRAGSAIRSTMPAYALAAVAVVALLIGVLIGQVTLRSQQSGQTGQPQATRFTLTGHQDMAGASASVVDLKSDGLALIDFRGLPPAGANRVYEVWLVPSKGDPVPAAVFVPDSNGSRVVLVNRSLSGYSVMAVTDEPAPDGSAAPTQQPQLYGSVA
jgi:anti-sigma-K factor RskA